MDPLEFRLKNPRTTATRGAGGRSGKFGWGKSEGAFGIAAGFEKNGYVSSVAVAVDRATGIRVLRVVTAFDCGAMVNPED